MSVAAALWSAHRQDRQGPHYGMCLLADIGAGAAAVGVGRVPAARGTAILRVEAAGSACGSIVARARGLA